MPYEYIRWAIFGVESDGEAFSAQDGASLAKFSLRSSESVTNRQFLLLKSEESVNIRKLTLTLGKFVDFNYAHFRKNDFILLYPTLLYATLFLKEPICLKYRLLSLICSICKNLQGICSFQSLLVVSITYSSFRTPKHKQFLWYFVCQLSRCCCQPAELMEPHSCHS